MLIKTGFLPTVLNRKGQSIVEISLITPLLLVALYVPADFAIAYLTAHLTQNAVREAARLGAASKTPFDGTAASAIKTEAENRMPARLSGKTATVKYFSEPAPCLQFIEVKGEGTYNYGFYRLISLMGGAASPRPISRTTRMRYEFQSDANGTLCTTATVIIPAP
jgi:TadE-like protein